MSRNDIRVAVAGVRGKMGNVARQAIEAADGMRYVGGLVRADAGAGEYTAVASLIRETQPDVIVDFTHFPASKAIALDCIEHGARPVVGTSGYGAEDIEELRAASERRAVGCVFVPNFGIGAALMMKFAAEAAPYYATADIIETHESGKRDAPSGTAMATARAMGAAGSFTRAQTAMLKVEGTRGGEVNGIGIHSLRLPGVVAHQEVIFGGDGETLRIVHDSASRTSFMPGLLRVVRGAARLSRFVQGLENFL